MPRFTKDDHSIETDVPSERLELIAGGWTEETVEIQQEKTVEELKEELKALNLPTSGTKPQLIERLAGEAPADS